MDISHQRHGYHKMKLKGKIPPNMVSEITHKKLVIGENRWMFLTNATVTKKIINNVANKEYLSIPNILLYICAK